MPRKAAKKTPPAGRIKHHFYQPFRILSRRFRHLVLDSSLCGSCTCFQLLNAKIFHLCFLLFFHVNYVNTLLCLSYISPNFAGTETCGVRAGRSGRGGEFSSQPSVAFFFDYMVLDPARRRFGKPIRVTSGYRCPLLNKAVGGARRSYHLQGRAADLVTESIQENQRLYGILQLLPHRELIWEQGGRWIHVAI